MLGCDAAGGRGAPPVAPPPLETCGEAGATPTGCAALPGRTVGPRRAQPQGVCRRTGAHQRRRLAALPGVRGPAERAGPPPRAAHRHRLRSEEHTSELQSQFHLVCRLLLEKKKKKITNIIKIRKKKKKNINK